MSQSGALHTRMIAGAALRLSFYVPLGTPQSLGCFQCREGEGRWYDSVMELYPWQAARTPPCEISLLLSRT